MRFRYLRRLPGPKRNFIEPEKEGGCFICTSFLLPYLNHFLKSQHSGRRHSVRSGHHAGTAAWCPLWLQTVTGVYCPRLSVTSRPRKNPPRTFLPALSGTTRASVPGPPAVFLRSG